MRSDGVAVKVPHLIRRLDHHENPYLGLFLRFFPLPAYLAHLEAVANMWATTGASRHEIPFDQGTLLRFMGMLMRISMTPLPAISWHWRYPGDLPQRDGEGVKHLLREVVFNKYWQYCIIPGSLEPITEEADMPSTGSQVYQRVLELVDTCTATWRAAWSPGDVLVADETMVAW